FIIVPAASHDYVKPEVRSVVIAFVLIGLVFLVPPYAMTWSLANLHTIASAMIAAFLFLVFASSYVSPFKLLLSTAAFEALVCVLLLRRLWSPCALVWRKSTQARWSSAAIHVSCSALVLVI